MKLLIRTYFFLILTLFSCDVEKHNECTDLTNLLLLDSAEVIYEYQDKYPISLAKQDSLLYVINIKSDTCMSVINLNTQEELCSFGSVGHGDKDLLNPNFILSINSNKLLLDVGNLRRIVDVDYRGKDSIVMSDMEYPDLIFMASELNISDKYIVGRKVDAYDDNMFFIYDRSKKEINTVPCYPDLHYSVLDYNYTYASVLALNEEKGRIVSGMYFFDMFHLYDLSGSRLKTIKFSDDCYPHIDRESGRIDFSKGYNGVIRAYATSKSCYLLRMIMNDLKEAPQYMLIRMDWEGEVQQCFMLKNNVSGQFCVDEENNKVYIIENHIDGDGEEIFSIMSYNLKRDYNETQNGSEKYKG